MKRILAIFRKDVSHLWPQALVCWAALVVVAIDQFPRNWGSGSFMGQLLPALQPLACWLLVVSAIHGERLIGHEQYWLTRPYSWKHLMAAKGLLLVALVNLPLLVCHIATLAALGISPLAWLPALLWRQVFFTIFFVLPVAAVAAVTRNLGQVLLAGILLYVTFAAGVVGLGLGRGWSDWGGLGWIRVCGMALVIAAGTLVALALQYSRRRTALSRATLAATLVLATLVMATPRWGGAFAIQKLLSHERIGDTAVRISFDESRAGTQPKRLETALIDPTGVWLEIPIRVDHVPPGVAVGTGWTSVSLKSTRGTWRSGWLAFHSLHDLTGGEAWLTVHVDPNFYNASADAAVELDGTANLTLGRRVRTLAMKFGRILVPEIGICLSSASRCYSPFQRVSFDLTERSSAFPEVTSQDGPYAPFPTSIGFGPLNPTPPMSWTITSADGEFSQVMRRPVAYVQRDFKARGLKMSQFMMPRK